MTSGNAYLALYPTQFLLAVEHVVEMLAVLIHVIASVRAISLFRARVPAPAPAAFARFCVCRRSFLVFHSFRFARASFGKSSSASMQSSGKHTLKNAHRGPHAPGLADASCSHRVSSLVFPFHPWDWIHLPRAKRSHLVGGLGLGKGVARGR